MSEVEQSQFLVKLSQAGIIRELRPQQQCFTSPALFFRKGNSKGIRKVCDYWLLNPFSHTQGCALKGVQSILRKIPEIWKVFCVKNVTNTFWNVPVHTKVFFVLWTSAVGHHYTHKNLNQNWKKSLVPKTH